VWLYTLLGLVVVWLVVTSLKRQEPREEEAIEVDTKALSPAEEFALNIGNLEYQRLSYLCHELTLLDCLEKRWGIRFEGEFAKERVLYTLQKILSQGSVDRLIKNRKAQESFCIKDMVAFDSASFVELVRQSMALKLLSDEEAWGFLFLNAERVQDSFESWEAFQNAYLKGAEFHALGREKEASYNLEKIEVAWLKENLFSHLKIERKEER